MNDNKKIEQILVVGGGKNQINFIKLLNKKNYNTIVIDKKNKFKKYIKNFIKFSIYSKNLKDIEDKLKNLNISNVIYRSSGPSILMAYKLEKFFKIKRIDPNLANSIYSKFFFQKFLKKNKLPHFIQKKILNIKSLKNYKSYKVVKSDSPIIGKKGIIIKKKFSSKDLNFCRNNSHNRQIILGNFVSGKDVNSFLLLIIKKKFTN